MKFFRSRIPVRFHRERRPRSSDQLLLLLIRHHAPRILLPLRHPLRLNNLPRGAHILDRGVSPGFGGHFGQHPPNQDVEEEVRPVHTDHKILFRFGGFPVPHDSVAFHIVLQRASGFLRSNSKHDL